MLPIAIHKLPVAKNPQPAELVIPEGPVATLNSVDKSFVLAHSLRQSRYLWLTGMLPKFASKARPGKEQGHSPAPHILHLLGKCDFRIGPHIFESVSIFDVRYTSNAAGPDQPGHPPMSLVTTLDEQVKITPGLIARINEASISDQSLANLLQLAASQSATPTQLRALGSIVQALAANLVDGSPSRDNPKEGFMDSAAEVSVVTNSSDVVLEFFENANDRWLLPKNSRICSGERSTLFEEADLTIRVDIAYSSSPSPPDNVPEQGTHPAFLNLYRASSQIKKLITSRFSYDDTPGENVIPTRSYLQYYLEDGPLLSQLQQSNCGKPSTKYLRPSSYSTSNSRRKAQANRRAASRPVPLPSHEAHAESSNTDVAAARPGMGKELRPYTPVCQACGLKDIPLVTRATYCRACTDSRNFNDDSGASSRPRLQP